jgi:TonB-linked SusC/RagA family outer membrane protein
MKNLFQCVRRRTDRYTTYVFLLFLSFVFANSVNAQAINDKPITLRVSNESVEHVFSKISKQTNLKFFYDQSSVNKASHVTLNMKNAAIEQVLEAISSQTRLLFNRVSNTISVSLPKAPAKSSQSAQQPKHKRTITGTVVDSKGEAVIGANVKLKGEKLGAITDLNGKFALSVPDDGIVEVSYIGYEDQEFSIRGKQNFIIRLKENSKELDEVVVVGYGQQKKVNLTGAVDHVGSEVFENRSLSNVTQALQGTIPNLNLSLEDGKPTRSASFNVRGNTSIGQGGSALVLIDGVEGDPSMLNPNDVASVSVLKDAASSAIYGARGSFGVVLITTKSAQKGKVSVNYTGNFTFEKPTKTPDYVTDGIDFAEHFRSSWNNYYGTIPTALNGFQPYSDTWLENFKSRREKGETDEVVTEDNGKYTYYGNTDWYDELYKNQTFAQDHNVTISGGSDKADFYISSRFYKYDGLYNYNPDDYKSVNLRVKGSLNVTNWLKITNNMEFTNNDYHNPTGISSTWTLQRFIELTAFPTMPLFNPDGTYTKSMAATLGAFRDGNNYIDTNKKLLRNTTSFVASFFKNKLRINGDYTYRYGANEVDQKNYQVEYSEAVGKTAIRSANNNFTTSNAHTTYIATNIYAEYEDTFAKDHYFKGMVGYNYETSKSRYNYMQRNGLLLPSASTIALATGTNITNGESISKWDVEGVFFRLNYSYKDRYLLEVNGRYDGSSKFPENDKWGFFPSVSVGWRVSEEPFWKVDKKYVSNMKLRASYGSLGNGNVSPYSYLELLNTSVSGRVIGGALNTKTSCPAVKPNNLTWETATTTDLGIDLGLLDGTLNFTGDYYMRKTKNMYTVGMTLPDVFGASSPKGNYADMTTRGFELSLSYRNHFTLAEKPFNFEVRATLADYTSKIDKYNNSTKSLSDYYEGMKLGEMWGYETDGLFQSDSETTGYVNTIMQASNNKTWHAGDVKFVDRNNNGKIDYGENTKDNPGDRKIIGNSQPRYMYSFTLSGDWNGIFVSAFFTGVGKQNWYPTMESSAFWGQYNRPYNNVPKWQLGNYWTEDNPNAYLPRYSCYNSTCGRGGSSYYNDRYLQKISYLRLKSLQLGYNLPKSLISHVLMQSARIYLTGENLFSWSPLYKHVKGFDVMSISGDTDSDLSSSNSQGSGNSYPLMKSISLGLSITF